MEGEVVNFIVEWLIVYASLCYCYLATKILPKGLFRLFSFLPIICLFIYLPLKLNSILCIGSIALSISWFCNFKLILLAFDRGPLTESASSLRRFLILASFPIAIQQEYGGTQAAAHQLWYRVGSVMVYGFKALLFALIIRVLDYNDSMNRHLIFIIYCVFMYLYLEMGLGVVTGLGRGLLRVELEPRFNKPYVATSLQDFWGRRWNLMSTRILGSTVYKPSLRLTTRVLGRNWGPLAAMMATFVVSGLMHELLYYYWCRVNPTWEVTWFFSLQGMCLVIEMFIKQVFIGRFQLPRMVQTILTIGFVTITGFWLLFNQLIRCNAFGRACAEFYAVAAFLKDAI